MSRTTVSTMSTTGTASWRRWTSRTAMGYQYPALPPVGDIRGQEKFLGKLQRKEEEMRQMFVNKEKETELELKEKQREIHEESSNLKPVHQEEMQEVEEKRQEPEEEAAAFNPRPSGALQAQVACHVAGAPEEGHGRGEIRTPSLRAPK